MLFGPQALVQPIQRRLNFEGWDDYPQFSTTKSLGRVATVATVLGMLWGLHAALFLQTAVGAYSWSALLSLYVQSRLLRWSVYGLALTSFHLTEFFVTAIYNHSSALSADSFLVNQSTAYTTAALTSWVEFAVWTFFVDGRVAWSPTMQRLAVMGQTAGLVCMIVGQLVRSVAMQTAGSSFHHVIQIQRHHILITHGIYQYLRHGSYTGFFYWSVGTQLWLGNPLHALAYTVATWVFFQRRIQYEEHVLCHYYPTRYPAYCARTYIGIPGVPSFGYQEYQRLQKAANGNSNDTNTDDSPPEDEGVEQEFVSPSSSSASPSTKEEGPKLE